MIAPDEAVLVECRSCGKRWKSLGHHLRHGHGMSADEYRDRFGIRRSEPLTSPETRARFSEHLRSRIESGRLDAHFATNGERASAAGAAAKRTRRHLREAGVPFAPDPRTTPRHSIESIVAAIEGGAKVATAVKRSPIGYTTFHAGLGRHPDLKARVEAAKRQRK